MEAGTKIKNLTGRLMSAEKVAQNLFNDTMKLNNVVIDGKLFDYQSLTKFAQQDVGKAIELMSKLRKEGVLSNQVLSKLFTSRHYGDISNLLLQINGDIDGFVRRLATGVDYTADAYKNMFNLNTQFKILDNNVHSSFGGIMKYTKNSLTGLTMGINSLLQAFNNFSDKNMNSGIGGFLSGLSSVALMSAMSITTIYTLFKTLSPLLVSVGVTAGGILATLSAWLLPVTAIIGAIAIISNYMLKTKKHVFDFVEGFGQVNKQIEDTISQSEILNSKLLESKMLLELASNDKLNDGLERSNILIDSLLSKSKAFKDYYLANQNWSMDNFEGAKAIVRGIEERKKKLSKDIQDIKKRFEEYQNSFLKPKEFIGDKNSIYYEQQKATHEGNESKRIPALQAVMEVKVNDVENKLSPDDIVKEASKLLKERGQNIGEWSIKQAIRTIETSQFDEIKEELKVVNEKIKELDVEHESVMQSHLKQAQANIEADNKEFGLLMEERLDELSKRGFTFVGDKEISGLSGLVDILNSDFENQQNITINQEKAKIESWENSIAYVRKTNEELAEEDESLIKDYESKIKQAEIVIANVKKGKESLSQLTITNDDLDKYLPKIKLTSENFNDVVQALLMIQQLKKNIFSNEGFTETNKYQSETEMLKRRLREIEDIEKDAERKRSSDTKYQLKHISLLREELQLELERAKIGASLEQQAYLEYEYKLKTLQANKDIAQDEKESVYKLVKSYSAEPKEGASYLAKALKTNSAKEIVELLNEFESKYSGIMTGENGRKVKSDYDEIIKLLNALKGVEKAGENFKIEILKGINAVQNTMVSSIYKELSTNNPKYIQQYTSNLLKEFENQKKKIGKDFGLGDSFNLRNELERSGAKLDLLKAIGADPNKLKDFKDEVVEIFGEDIYNDMSKSQENMALVMSKVTNENKALLDLEKKRLDYNQEITKSLVKQADALGSIAGLFNNMGNAFKSEFFTNIGGTINAIKDMQKHLKDPNNKFDLSSVFSTDKFIDELGNVNWDSYFDNFSKAFENMNKSMMQGSSIGTLVGSITGGGASSQVAGGLAGLITGAMSDLNPFASMGIQAGASLIGGLFGRGGMSQAEAERRTKESNKIYNKNTEALQKLAQNMANLSGGVDGLNSTLLSSFSKIPTVGNLERISDSMTQLYKTMDKTRIFNNVAYQVTKTKSKKGFLGIGGSARSWTETTELSPQDMLRKYGYKGTIYDMKNQDLRDFSKWLKDYSLGETDNFSVLGDAIEDYVNALEKMDRNVSNIFRDITMEGFEGISALQQEELRTQIESFYKNLGIQIDDDVNKQIDKLAEQMSVMVTIMTDVRNDFVNSWKDTGLKAGTVFVKSMSPFVESMLSNISQIFYDVYYSDINKKLEDEFKNFSEQLVELKKKGQNLNWDSVTEQFSYSFEKVTDAINVAKQETTSFNDTLKIIQQQALDNGLGFSELFDLGLTTDTQRDILDNFKEALNSSEADGAFKSIGNMVGGKIGNALVDKLVNNMMSDKILKMSSTLDDAISGNLSFESLASLSNEAMSVGLMLEGERLRFEAIKDMFDFNRDITYAEQDNSVQYTSGTSQKLVQNFYLSSNVEAGNVIESDSIERLADSLLDTILEKLRVERGIAI